MSEREQNRWLKRGVIFGCWTLLVLIFATQSYLFLTARAETRSWKASFLWACSEWYTWAALSPLILRLARRFPVERQSWRREALIHFAASVVFALLQPLLQATVKFVGLGGDLRPRPFSVILSQLLFTKIHINLITYWVIAGTSHAAEYYRRYRDRELKASQLEIQLAQAQLQALRMQIHPHFLFNALNSISALIDEDHKAAGRMVSRLGKFLRLTLQNATAQTVPLRRELEFIRSYLEIEQVRFEDRLAVEVRIEPDALGADVPCLILQPIIENAVRHGIAPLETGGKIEVHACRRDAMLRVQVKDNGPGLAAGADGIPANGIGLRNTQLRLRTLYGDAQRFEVANAPDGGLVVTMEFPLRREESFAAPEASETV
ncbi:MAG TPA: histidine kinase [Blastocatellia bacterium]|nr:histidine kinase [Blastocatellia bacterium]